MSGTVWMFSDQIDDEDIDFMHREFVTYNMASIYYGLGMKPVIRMSHECGAIKMKKSVCCMCSRVSTQRKSRYLIRWKLFKNMFVGV